MANLNADVLLVPGGLGLFLLGMVVLTEGLRALAGDALRRLLARFTETPLRGVAAGALTTAIIQSSSATTVTAVGFVGAGLLTFSQGLGIVLGANIGTTVTGWIVAVVGFKLKLGLVVLPLVLLGILLRLFAGGRWRHLGWALTGFCVLFVGIDAMQQGMAPFEGAVTPSDFPGDSLWGRLQLVLIGVAITLVTQSSSAGVAIALVALGSGTISFAQAAALVIGMDVGTTFTAALATLGGSTAMRQTGYAHVVYNVLTGVMAFILLGPFAFWVEPWIAAGGGAAGDAQLSLVAFHTVFNVLGVVLILPFTRPFARLITRLVPDRGPRLLRRLDERLLREPAAAVDGVAATIRDITDYMAGVLQDLLDPAGARAADSARLAAAAEALETTRRFTDRIRTEPNDGRVHGRHLASVHALDHLIRLTRRCGQEARVEALAADRRLRRLAAVLRGSVTLLTDSDDADALERRFDRLRVLMRDQRHRHRDRTVAAAARQRVSADAAVNSLDAVRWLHRVAYHLWRILHHRRRAQDLRADPAWDPPLHEELEED